MNVRTPARSEEEARAILATVAPQPPAGPYVFVNANPKNSHRLHRGGEPLCTRTVYAIVRLLRQSACGPPDQFASHSASGLIKLTRECPFMTAAVTVSGVGSLLRTSRRIAVSESPSGNVTIGDHPPRHHPWGDERSSTS